MKVACKEKIKATRRGGKTKSAWGATKKYQNGKGVRPGDRGSQGVIFEFGGGGGGKKQKGGGLKGKKGVKQVKRKKKTVKWGGRGGGLSRKERKTETKFQEKKKQDRRTTLVQQTRPKGRLLNGCGTEAYGKELGMQGGGWDQPEGTRPEKWGGL